MAKQGSAAQLQAMSCALFMRKRRYNPATIVSVGVGTAPELMVWKWLFPMVNLVGIDPRNRISWPEESYTRAAAGDGSVGHLTYCRSCRATACETPGHNRKGTVPVVTVDSVAKKYPGPFFLWLDCEGAEISALQGAKETLKNTRWLNVEVRDFEWDKEYSAKLESFLLSQGFRLYFQGLSQDRLYRRK